MPGAFAGFRQSRWHRDACARVVAFTRYRLQILIATLVIMLSACAPLPEPPTRVAIGPWLGYDPLVLARELDLLEPEHLRVVDVMSYSDSLRLFANGFVEAAMMTLDDALLLAEEGVPLRISMLLSESNGNDAVLADPAIGSVSSLAGELIALEDSTVGWLILDRMLAQAGLSREQVRTLSTETHLHQRSLASGEVKAVVTYEPVKSRLVRAGYRVIFDSSSMPGEIVDVLVVRRDLSPAREAAIHEAWRRGLIALLDRETQTLDALARGAGLAPDEYVSALEGLRFFPPDETADRLTPATMAQNHAELVQQLLASEVLQSLPDWRSLLQAPMAGSR